MTVQELIDALQEIQDKEKIVIPVISTGMDEDIPFFEEGRTSFVKEGERYVELMDEVSYEWLGKYPAENPFQRILDADEATEWDG